MQGMSTMIKILKFFLCAGLFFLLPLVFHKNASRASDLNADDILAQMSVDEKIGQLFMPGIPDPSLSEETAAFVKETHLGGVIVFAPKNVMNRAQTARLTKQLQEAAKISGAKIPLLISIDQEGGVGSHVNMLTGGVDTVGNLALGASVNPEDTYASYKIMAQDLRAYGINMALAPVLDLLLNKDNPMNHVRSFGESPELAAKLAPSAVKGFQENGILACAKHFPGKGGTAVDSHKSAPVNTEDIKFFREKILSPFHAAVKAGADSVMIGHEIYTAVDTEHVATVSHKIITDLLKNEMGFQGIVITDSITMGGVSESMKSDEASYLSIKAGADMILFAGDSTDAVTKAIARIKRAIEKGELNISRVDDAVRRVLNVKIKYGLFSEMKTPSKEEYKKQKEENYKTSVSIARKTVTLVKNDKTIIPIPADGSKKILVVCPRSMVSVAMMDMVFPVGTTLGLAVRAQVPDVMISEYDLVSIEDDKQKAVSAAGSADVIVVGSFHAYFSPEITALIKALKTTGKPVVVVGMTVPYDLEKFPEVDAFLAIYNPRSVSLIAAAEALFGKITPKGKLPVTLKFH